MTDEHQSNTGVAKEVLQGYVERLNNLTDESERLRDDKSVLRGEIKKTGFDPKAVAEVVKRSRLSDSDKQKRREQNDVIEMYASALGCNIFD